MVMVSGKRILNINIPECSLLDGKTHEVQGKCCKKLCIYIFPLNIVILEEYCIQNVK